MGATGATGAKMHHRSPGQKGFRPHVPSSPKPDAGWPRTAGPAPCARRPDCAISTITALSSPALAIAGAVHQAAGADRGDLATKADIGALKGDIDALRKETKADLHREIGTLRSELRWILGFLAALILAMAAELFGIV